MTASYADKTMFSQEAFELKSIHVSVKQIYSAGSLTNDVVLR